MLPRRLCPTAAVLLLTLAPGSAAAQLDVPVHCRVFDDADSSGTFDPGEMPLAGVRVTDGLNVLLTDAEGKADLSIRPSRYRFATLTVPAGWWPTTPWYHPVPIGATGPDTVDFGLKPLPASATDVDSIRWVHISDTQVHTWGSPFPVVEDLAQINDVPGPLLFLINTGDLVETGSDTTHWNNYVAQIATSTRVVLPVVGNHDTLSAPAPLEYYERYMGPPYYSFDAGRWHFVVYNTMVQASATPAQDDWLANDVAAAPPGSYPLLFMHYMLQETNPAKVEAWAQMGFVACFSGHWHCHQFIERPAGILEFNICRLKSGPLDRTPRAFGIVTCTSDGEIRYDLRRLEVDHRSEITWPRPDQVVARDAVEVLVQAYDTSSLVASLGVALSGPGGMLPATPLARGGISLWRGLLDASSLPEGVYDLVVTGAFDDGTPISLVSSCVLGDVVPIRRWPGSDWPMFRKCPAGSSFVASPLEPPLTLAWTTPVPGMVALSSPVVADGRVYVGCRAERSLDEAGVLACDATTGAIEWFTRFPGGVALAPAVAGGVVLATAMSDSVFGLDATTGGRVWSVPQIYSRYSMVAPIVEGETAWVGAEPRPRQVRAATGAVDWTAFYLGDAWFPYIYSAPAVGPDHVAWGFFGWTGVTTGGLRILGRATGALVYAEEGAFRSPLRTGDTLYVIGGADRNHQVLTARTPTGSILWTAPGELGGGTASPALGHDVLVIPGVDGAVEGLRATDGERLWTKPVDRELYDMESGQRGARGTPGTAAIADRTVWIASLDGNLYALDLDTGTERWRWNFGVPVASSPAIAGNMLFLAAEDEHLYAFVSGEPAAGVGSSAGRASVFSFYPPRPNPSGRQTRFAWVMPARGRARLRVFDVRGRLVRTVTDGVRDAGEHEAIWDGLDDGAHAAAAGVYFARLDAGDRSLTHRFVRLRR